METVTEGNRIVVVLGTSHALQMAENREDREHNVHDPLYIKLIEHFRICAGMPLDIIFEEASGCGPTAAQKLAEDFHVEYMDIDAHPNDRHLYGLSRETSRPLNEPFESVMRTCAEEHFKREAVWVERIRNAQFQVALVICGLAHILSLTGRLMSAGFKVFAHEYVPHDKLCRRTHAADGIGF